MLRISSASTLSEVRHAQRVRQDGPFWGPPPRLGPGLLTSALLTAIFVAASREMTVAEAFRAPAIFPALGSASAVALMGGMPPLCWAAGAALVLAAFGLAPVGNVLGVAGGASLGALFVSWWLRRTGFDTGIHRHADARSLVLAGAFLGAPTSAVLATITNWGGGLAPHSGFPERLLIRLLADFTGYMLIVPLALSWWSWWKASLAREEGSGNVAHRRGIRGAATGGFAATLAIVLASAADHGPFASTDVLDRFVSAFLFSSAALATSLLLAASIQEARRVRAELGRNEKRYRSLIENGHDLIAILDSQGHFVFASESLGRTLGEKAEALLARSLFDFLHPEDLLRLRGFLGDSLSGLEKPVPVTLRISQGGGSWRSLEATCSDLRHDPCIQGFVFNARDVTERQQAERSLRESQRKGEEELEKSRLLIERISQSVPGLTFVFDLAERSPVHVEGRLLEILGYTSREVLQLGAGAFAAIVQPEDVSRAVAFAHRLSDLADGEIAESDVRLKGRNGEKIWVSQRVLVFSRDSEGKARLVVGVAIDVTASKGYELALEETRGSLEALVRNSRDALWSIDRELRLIWFNPAFTTSFAGSGPRPPLAGHLPEDYLTAEQAREIRPLLLRALSGESLTEDWCTPSLEIFELALSPIRGHGEISGVSGSLRDVTARKKAEISRASMERRSLEAQRLESLGLLAGGIAHDFNNLLVGILGNASYLCAELERETQQWQAAREVEISARRLADLTREMLKFAGKEPFTPRPVDLGSLFREMAELLRPALSRDARLAIEMPGSLPPIEADPTQIRQVVMNLLTNASEALGGRPGVISVRLHRTQFDRELLEKALVKEGLSEGPCVCLEISDTGCGMAPHTLARIFDPFFTTKFAGRGLGLSSVLGIVRSHKGTILVESTPGEGTSVRVFLPAASRAASPLSGEFPAPAWRGSGTILVIDDSPSVVRALAVCLRPLGFTCIGAATGAEGVSRLREIDGRASAVFLDLTMPILSGPEVMTAIRVSWPEIPVILMSGFHEGEARDIGARSIGTFMDQGVPFLQKPFSIEDVSRVLRKAVSPDSDDGGTIPAFPAGQIGKGEGPRQNEEIMREETRTQGTRATILEENQDQPQPLSTRLREGTRAVHTKAERAGIMPVLVAGKADRAQYRLFLSSLAHVYEPLEKAMDRHQGHPLLSRIHFPELFRMPSLRNDIEFLGGADPSAATTATRAYGERIAEISKDHPELLAAHAYVRYMGDMSGGQIIKEIVRKTLGITEDSGLSFYEFRNIEDLPGFKAKFRRALDELPLEEEGASGLVSEAVRAFELNIAIFETMN